MTSIGLLFLGFEAAQLSAGLAILFGLGLNFTGNARIKTLEKQKFSYNLTESTHKNLSGDVLSE